jgi:hypothetical protein
MKTKIIAIISIIGLIYSCNKETSVNTLSDGLISHYPFNGNANDASGNGYNGKVYGATLTTDRFGNNNEAYYFDGVDNYISLQPADKFAGRNTYSVSLWVMPTTTQLTATNGGIIYGIGSSINGYQQALTYEPDSSYFAGSYNIGNNPTQSASQSCSCYPPNVWSFVVVTRDTSYIKMYINGILVTVQTMSKINGQNANYGSGGYAAILGGRSDLQVDKFYTGKIDDFRFYNRILTVNEILELKNLNE